MRHDAILGTINTAMNSLSKIRFTDWHGVSSEMGKKRTKNLTNDKREEKDPGHSEILRSVNILILTTGPTVSRDVKPSHWMISHSCVNQHSKQDNQMIIRCTPCPREWPDCNVSPKTFSKSQKDCETLWNHIPAFKLVLINYSVAWTHSSSSPPLFFLDSSLEKWVKKASV